VWKGGGEMKVKDPIKFVGGKERAKKLLQSMEGYIKSSPPLKNCWFSYGGGERFIHPYKASYSVSYKQLKELLK